MSWRGVVAGVVLGVAACGPEEMRAAPQCGVAPDGRGGVAQGGWCAQGAACGARMNNVCSDVSAAPSAPWLRTFEHPVTAVAAGVDGTLVAAVTRYEGSTLLALDTSGKTSWERAPLEPFVSYRGLSVSPLGSVLAWGWWGESFPGHVLHRYPRGSPHAAVEALCGDLCSIRSAFEDGTGSLIQLDEGYALQESRTLRRWSGAGATWNLRFVRSDLGHGMPMADPASPTPFSYTALALDPRGDVLALAQVFGQTSFAGRSLGTSDAQRDYLLRFSPQGALLDALQVPLLGRHQLVVTEQGDVVGLGAFWESFAWQGTSVAHDGVRDPRGQPQPNQVVYRLGSDGVLRWIRVLPRVAQREPRGRLAVGVGGDIAVAREVHAAEDGSGAAVQLDVLDADGQPTARRVLAAPEGVTGSVQLGGLVVRGADVVLSGAYTGEVELDVLGRQRAPEGEGRSFLLSLPAW